MSSPDISLIVMMIYQVNQRSCVCTRANTHAFDRMSRFSYKNANNLSETTLNMQKMSICN